MSINQIGKKMDFGQQELTGYLSLTHRWRKPKVATAPCPTGQWENGQG